MSWDKLSLYNAALKEVGEGPLSSLTEDRESRYKLDSVWSSGDGAARAVLEQGLWNFATRSVQIDSSDSVTPSFGFTYAFAIPTDFVRLVQLSADETFSLALEQYEIEGSYLYAYVDPIYMRFVSDDADWGGDFSRYPMTYGKFFGLWLANEIAPSHVGAERQTVIEKKLKMARVDARSKDAQQEPTRYLPHGTWANARSRGGVRRDNGSRSRLIG